MDLEKPFLLIPDLQIPFEHYKALNFCRTLKDHYRIPDSNILCLGDEVDNLSGGMYPKSPDGDHTPKGEIREAQMKIREWAGVFPEMKVCTSNHGMRWIKKASAAEIPSQMLKAYQDVLKIPEKWKYADSWTIPTKHPFKIIHGMEYSGKTPYRVAAELSPISIAFGHLHSSAGICRVITNEKDIWSMNCGSLIDKESYAFAYGKYHKFHACNGASIVFNKGTTPVLIPLDSF